MAEHTHEDIYNDLDRVSARIGELDKRTSNLESTLQDRENDLWRAESDIRDLENKVSNLERGY